MTEYSKLLDLARRMVVTEAYTKDYKSMSPWVKYRAIEAFKKGRAGDGTDYEKIWNCTYYFDNIYIMLDEEKRRANNDIVKDLDDYNKMIKEFDALWAKVLKDEHKPITQANPELKIISKNMNPFFMDPTQFTAWRGARKLSTAEKKAQASAKLFGFKK